MTERSEIGLKLIGVMTLLICIAVPVGCGSNGDNKEDSADTRPAVGVKAAGLIAFHRFLDEAQTQQAVFTIRPDGTGERQLTRPPKDSTDEQPTISADGKRIAFERCSEGKPCHVFIMGRDGSDLQRLEVRCTLKPICDDSGPAWSRDGSLVIILASGREKTGDFGNQIQRSEVVVVDPEGGTQRSVARLDDWQGDLRGPVWSPDGERIVYQQTWSALSKRGSGDTLRVVAARGGKSRQITPYRIAAGDHPDWSPDGKWVIFRNHADTEDPPSQLYLVHPDGTGLKELRTPGDSVLSSSFSPDGKWIAYGAPDASGSADVYVIRSDGAENRPLTRTKLWDSAPDWGP